MRILFATDAGDTFVSMWEPVGQMMLTSLCKQAGHEVRFASLKPRRIAKTMEEFKPHVVGFSVPSSYLSSIQNLNRFLKGRFDYTSVFGGKHPTIVPGIIHDDPAIDAVAMGEADHTFPAFLAAMESGNAFETTEGFWVRRDGQVFENPRAPLVKDLDALPFMDREAIYEVAPYKDNPIKGFLAERGCPYNCTYCFNKHFRDLYKEFGSTVRYRNVDSVIEELKKVRKDLGFQMVYFFDEVFSSSKKWLFDFCDAYRREVNLPFAITHRIDFMTEEVTQALADAGCTVVLTGIEAGNEKIRRDLLNRPMSNQLILEHAQKIRSSGIMLILLNLLGVPETTLDDDIETYQMNLRAKVDYAHSAVFQPYPGTVMTDLAIERGYFTGTAQDLTPRDFMKGRSRLNIPDRKARQRLDSFFSTAAHFKLKPKTVKTLVRLPLGPLFRLFRLIIKTRIGQNEVFPVDFPLTTKIRMAWRVLRTHF